MTATRALGRIVPFALASLMVLSSCDDSTAACPKLRACDITLAECQDLAMSIAHCWRGGPAAPPVNVEIRDRDEYIAESIAKIEQAPVDAKALTVRRGYALFGLSRFDHSTTRAAETAALRLGGFYTAQDHKVVVFPHQSDSPGAMAVLVHEMVHALQSGDAVKSKREAVTTDQFLAMRAILEGEATYIDHAASVEAQGLSVNRIDWVKKFASRANQTRFVASEDPIADSYSSFTYGYGSHYLAWVFGTIKPGLLREVWTHVPTATLQIMRPTWPDFQEPNENLSLPQLPPGYKLVNSDRLGNWLWAGWYGIVRTKYSCLERSVPDTRSDRFSVWSTEAGQTVAVWRIRLEPLHTNSSQLHTQLKQCFQGRHNVVTGEHEGAVWVAIGDAPDRAPEILGWGPSPPPLPSPVDGGLSDAGVDQ